MDSRNELRFQSCLQDSARLRDREVAAVAEHVTETRAGDVCVMAPLADLLCVCAYARPAVRRQCVRRQKSDLDAREILALAEPGKQANRFHLSLALQVVSG